MAGNPTYNNNKSVWDFYHKDVDSLKHVDHVCHIPDGKFEGINKWRHTLK